MDIATQKLDLMSRLMKVDAQKTLERVEELLIQEEMEARTQIAEEAIERGDVLTLEQFGKKSEEWLRKRTTE